VEVVLDQREPDEPRRQQRYRDRHSERDEAESGRDHCDADRLGLNFRAPQRGNRETERENAGRCERAAPALAQR